MKPSMENIGERTWSRSLPSGPFRFLEVNPIYPTPPRSLTHPLKEKDTKQRGKYTLPQESTAPSKGSTNGASSSTQTASPQNSSTTPSSEKSASHPAASQKAKPRPTASRKSKSPSQPPTSEGPAPQPSSPHDLLPTRTSPDQAVDTPVLPEDVAISAPIPPVPGTAVNPTPSPGGLGPNPSQIEPSQSLSESSKILQIAETAATQSGPDATISPQLTTNVADATTANSVRKVQYRVRNQEIAAPRLPSRRGSIDGAPEMVVDLHANSGAPSHQDSVDDDTPEIIVDLRDYISTMSDSDGESHVSSSQKTADGCRDTLSPSQPPSSQWRNSSRSQSTPTRTYAQLDADEGDLPVWMVKKSQWKYLVSTAGGPTWEKLLKVYMEQERRLEFTEMVSNLPPSSISLILNRL